MYRKYVTAFLCVGLANLSVGAIRAGAESNQDALSKAPSFTLEDQYGAMHEYAFPRERVLLVTIGGRGSTGDMDPWLEALHETYDGKIDFQGIAYLESVPYLARKLARVAIRNKTKDPVLCDWSGEISQGFGADSAAANVFVVSPDGRIQHHAKGPMTDVARRTVFDIVDGLLPSK